MTRGGLLQRLAERFERDDGGVPARQAVVRWAWRLFRRDWRQQTLVLGLLTVAVGAAIFGVTLTYNLAPAGDAEFGRADLLLRVDGSDQQAMEDDLAAAKDFFGTVETVRHRYDLIPGSVDTVELRGQEPDGVYSAPTLSLLEGRHPTGPDEVAVTDDVAETFGVEIGDVMTVERDRQVVGRVENPRDLEDEFALVDPSADEPQTVTVLVATSPERFRSFLRTTGSAWDHEWREEQKADAATTVFGLSALGMILIGLVAAAAFVVVAQRRQRQLGMIAAIGATAKHLRLVTLANGAVTGLAAAVLGAGLAVLAWFATGRRFEPLAQQRIDPIDIPWRMVVQGMLLVVVTATLAAWWPARVASRVPITQALSARPPRPRPLRRSSLIATVLVIAGAVCLAQADQTNGQLIAAGSLGVVLGVLFFSPVTIQVLARGAARVPVAARLALRDLARYQARSGAALAAISLALGIPAAIVISASAAEHRPDEGNLSDRQILIRAQDIEPDVPQAPIRTPGEMEHMETQVDRLATYLGDPTVIPLDMAVDPDEEPVLSFEGGEGGQPAVPLGYEKDPNVLGNVVAYIASPELLRYYGVDADQVSPDTQVFTVRGDPLYFITEDRRQAPEPVARRERLDAPGYTSAPNTLIAPAAARDHGWRPMRTGWFIETQEPLSSEQRQRARELAAAAGLTVETRHDVRDLPVIRDVATSIGLFLAMGILAMTVGLIRGEAARDLRTLTATGATSAVRRTLTGVTSGALALLGAVLGCAAAYVALGAGYIDDLGRFDRVPTVHLLVIVVGIPLLAASVGWLLAGREPSALGRQPIE